MSEREQRGERAARRRFPLTDSGELCVRDLSTRVTAVQRRMPLKARG